jgi:hypothetical protein
MHVDMVKTSPCSCPNVETNVIAMGLHETFDGSNAFIQKKERLLPLLLTNGTYLRDMAVGGYQEMTRVVWKRIQHPIDIITSREDVALPVITFFWLGAEDTGALTAFRYKFQAPWCPKLLQMERL